MPMPRPSPTDPTPAADTKQSLLDAAESLFAKQGVHRASLRAITREAGANLAAVNYHFGSKEGLLRAVLARRLEPLNRLRLERLDSALAETDPPGVEAIVRAFVAPTLTMVGREPGGHAFARFLTRTFSEPDPALRGLVLAAFEEVIQRFTEALRRALPHLGDDEVYWRFFFMVGAMAHTAGVGFLIERLSGGRCDPGDADGVIDRITAFLVGGLEAPAGATEARR